MDIAVVLGAVNAELGGRWQVERRLAGGCSQRAGRPMGSAAPAASVAVTGECFDCIEDVRVGDESFGTEDALMRRV